MLVEAPSIRSRGAGPGAAYPVDSSVSHERVNVCREDASITSNGGLSLVRVAGNPFFCHLPYCPPSVPRINPPTPIYVGLHAVQQHLGIRLCPEGRRSSMLSAVEPVGRSVTSGREATDRTEAATLSGHECHSDIGTTLSARIWSRSIGSQAARKCDLFLKKAVSRSSMSRRTNRASSPDTQRLRQRSAASGECPTQSRSSVDLRRSIQDA